MVQAVRHHRETMRTSVRSPLQRNNPFIELFDMRRRFAPKNPRKIRLSTVEIPTTHKRR
jgi:hypothetical protein